MVFLMRGEYLIPKSTHIDPFLCYKIVTHCQDYDSNLTEGGVIIRMDIYLLPFTYRFIVIFMARWDRDSGSIEQGINSIECPLQFDS